MRSSEDRATVRLSHRHTPTVSRIPARISKFRIVRTSSGMFSISEFQGFLLPGGGLPVVPGDTGSRRRMEANGIHGPGVAGLRGGRVESECLRFVPADAFATLAHARCRRA
jgi:hypothetical protein